MRTLSPCSERRLAGLAVTLGVLLAVTACGGGGGGSASDGGSGGGAAATVGVPSPPSSAGGASTGAGGSTLVALDAGTSCQLPDFRNSLLQAINAARAVARSCGGTAMPAVAPLAWNDALFSAAARHSTDMAVNNYFSHTGLDGRSAAQRIAAEGYAWSWVGENIAAGQTSVSTVMSGWLASAGHCANIMRAEYQDVGVSCVQRSGTTYGRYWTMTLARPR
ncbi:CAP domain-containing protein [Hydrogenophaga sp.]|uniref:CAP domain-containing protein n=1 Tax=Hydrogenophaga sp. TaxID=1904254 RepID=UPI00260EFBC5|nr:CAP domain-containing protein [Hydrogenophaga sp.]